MKRCWLVLILFITACSGIMEEQWVSPVPPQKIEQVLVAEASPKKGAKAALKLGLEPAALPAPAQIMDQTLPFEVLIHPDGSLYVGDRVSMEVVALGENSAEDRRVKISRADTGEVLVEGEPFQPYGIGSRDQVTLTWFWDTSGLESGDYELNLSVQPDGIHWFERITLHPAESKPPGENNAGWKSVRKECCIIHYISGTPADRDIDNLVEIAEREVDSVSRQMGYKLEEPISITFFPRVLGHGGFARSDISVAYLSRNYAGSSPGIVLHHEVVHALDARIGGELRPTILSEGLAVYLSGGHFKREALMRRSAALLDPSPACLVRLTAFEAGPDSQVCGLGWFLPLEGLSDIFYLSQHEIGYLEAGALVEYMVATWGWERFLSFYRDIHPDGDGENHSGALDKALRDHFGISLDGLQAAFTAALRDQELEPNHIRDVRYMVAFYNAVRRYQELLDPSAHFLTAWLPDNDRMRELGILADYLRRPSELENIALEAMLVEADFHLDNGEYDLAAEILAAVYSVLDGIQAGSARPFEIDSTSADYFLIAEVLDSAGMVPNRISLKGDQARAWVSYSGPEVQKIDLIATLGGWSLITQAGY
ncbi:MAG: hypothetical protein ACK2U3_06550 [Anaerolineales bacterium]